MDAHKTAAEEALRGSWDGVGGALRRHAHVSDLAVLVLDLRFGQAERLARLLRGDEEVRRVFV